MKTPVLIGSRALHFWRNDLKISEKTDYDVISENPLPECEWHDPSFLNNDEMLQYASPFYVVLPNGQYASVMNMRGLAIIKRSHLWRSLKFDRHITHYHKFGLADYALILSNTDKEVLANRIALTKKDFPQGNPNLMQSKEEFFNDAVEKIYDHDYIHELVAFNDAPLYTRILRDSNLVWCDKSKWNELSFNEKVQCVTEETYVIAIERFMVPKKWNYPHQLAYMKALNKVCTTLCSGWFRDFAIDHYPKIVLQYELERFNYVERKLNDYSV